MINESLELYSKKENFDKIVSNLHKAEEQTKELFGYFNQMIEQSNNQ
ncbi:hypothetical protein [Campylobacter sputorum]|nr:hypothetical protein [Campylobacter sputorum]